MKSTFKSDLEKEKRLSQLLDSCYSKHLKQYSFVRVHEKEKQLDGIDLLFKNKKTKSIFYIDEKAQLDYVNENLPTFAFELNYVKNGAIKEGWFLDKNKKTDFYALITAIYEDEPTKFTSCIITFVNRIKLLDLLKLKGITKKTLLEKYRLTNLPHGKTVLKELNPYTEGYLYHSKNNKAEQPINLILRLDWLLINNTAKKLF